MSQTQAAARPLPPISHRVLTYVLRHPAAMAVKRPLKDLIWSMRGASIVNPPVPAQVRSLLFVCKGNICRSPFAGVLAERMLARAGHTGIASRSAGISTTQAAASPADACAVASSYGLSLTSHRPQSLTRELMAAHDMVIVMEAAQLQDLRQRYPEHEPRLFLLSLFDPRPRGSYERYQIEDPFGHPRSSYEYNYKRIESALGPLLSAVTGRSIPGEAQ